MAVKKKSVSKSVKKAKPANDTKAEAKAIPSKQTKTQIISMIAEETGLAKKDVTSVFGTLGSLIGRHMKKRGSGELTIPETGVKIRRVRKPATKARMGRNPQTGEPMKFPAKPARTVVKVSALKVLKDSVIG